MSKDTAKYQLSCAKKYSSIFLDGNASSLLKLSTEKRIHVMKSLSSLSKYLGIYDNWQKIKSRYQLTWNNQSHLDIFKNIVANTYSFDTMIKKIKETCKNIKSEYSSIIIFCTMTGLRAEESFQSIRLLNSKERTNYINSKDMTLEHFRYPNIFLRRTKNTYISIINNDILELINYRNSKIPTYNSLTKMCNKNNVSIPLKDCRKVFATFLRSNGIEQEIIDLLQGRIPKSVFARYYYKPEIGEKYDKIKHLIQILQKRIS
jgi:intergrase/recombinase